MKKICTIIVLIFFSIALAACNTTAGFGRDVEKTGNWIEKKAE